MKESLRRRLAEPYPDGPKPARSVAFHDALGLRVPTWRQLSDAIASDRGTAPGEYGIAWWQNYAMDQTARILISDYTLQCLQSVQTNLIEAALHLAHYEAAAEAKTARIDRATKEQRSFAGFRSRTPLDEVDAALVDLHAAGVLRATGSTLDCAAVVAAVVAACPVPLIDLGFRSLRNGVAQRIQSSRVALNREYEAALSAALQRCYDELGPPGWLDWAIDLRNLFVHRGRRTSIDETNVTSLLLDQRGQKIPKVEILRRLPRSPARSDMEMFRDFAVSSPVLCESASVTLGGLVASLSSVVEALAATLLSIWATRKAAPNGVEQPTQQWPSRTFDDERFAGYFPDSLPFNPTSFHTSPAMSIRMKTAAMLDGQRESIWKRAGPTAPPLDRK